MKSSFNSMNTKLLIFGGGGYLGQCITDTLSKKNFNATIVDRFFYKNLNELIKNKNFVSSLIQNVASIHTLNSKKRS